MGTPDPKAGAFIQKARLWKEEMTALRKLLLDSPLTETWKWAQPCYTYEDKNVVMLASFKACCALGFFKGSLLKDPGGVLESPGKNSQAMRMAKFTSVQEIRKNEGVVKKLIREAVAAEKAGLKVEFKKIEDIRPPAELEKKLKGDKAFKEAFKSLTPGRQRAYILYFSSPKQTKTRESRIAKYEKHILKGKGMLDK